MATDNEERAKHVAVLEEMREAHRALVQDAPHQTKEARSRVHALRYALAALRSLDGCEVVPMEEAELMRAAHKWRGAMLHMDRCREVARIVGSAFVPVAEAESAFSDALDELRVLEATRGKHG
jgi:hypothetical protein